MVMIASPSAFALGAFNAMLATIIGAAGGHKSTWSPYQQHVFRTSSIYHFFCAFGMMFSGLVLHDSYASTIFQLGALLFCAPNYHTAFTNLRTFIFFSPFGGILMILAWGLLAYNVQFK